MHGDLAAPRLNALIGASDDPAACQPVATIRGRFGCDSAVAAAAEGRPVDNLVDCSAHAGSVHSDFLAWLGPEHAGLLSFPPSRTGVPGSGTEDVRDPGRAPSAAFRCGQGERAVTAGRGVDPGVDIVDPQAARVYDAGLGWAGCTTSRSTGPFWLRPRRACRE
ncbi:hypothetical protein J2S43_001054 [Catenuloplanes nepalensis]|uniref:Uncharacterized protein n=1 Tax=Catenuloplanes nepalensis TaxID=587533 RepID=A0ABT9MMB0_9ACTN|nr:hypothetical protein [Catenuloplanes nepalensis]MDP9792542.1 hypothetical protein [Catenuloplanes nepalensis]